MTMNLNQQDNRLIVNGFLKSKNLRHISLKTGSDAIVGSVDIAFKDKDKRNVQRVNVFAAKTTKNGKENPSYKSIAKVENEYAAADDQVSQPDRVHVTGHLDYNVFSNKNGNVIKTLRKNGAFFSRIGKDDSKYTNQARAHVILTVTGYEDEVKKGAPTGNKIIHNVNIGYGNRVNVIPNLTLSKDLVDQADTIVDTFPVGTTIDTQIAFGDYAVVQKSKQEAHGFGHKEQMEVATQFIHNAKIDYIEARPVNDSEKRKQALDQSQVNHAKDLLKQRVQRENQSSSQPANPFSGESTKVGNKEVSDDDLPF